MAAVECESKDNSANLWITSIISDETVETIEEHETLEIPLQSSWTFWLDKSEPGTTIEEYKKNLMKIYTVNTVQGFWAVFDNIPSISNMEVRFSYHLMRDERYPLWEEPVNQNGGTWTLKCQKADSELMWKEIVLAVIGEQFSECMAEDDEICGVTVSIRDKKDLIHIWNTNASLALKATVIQKITYLVPNVKLVIFYNPHQTHYAYGRR